MRTSVLIYEDNDLLRESLRNMLILNESIVVVGDYKNPLNIDKELKQLHPDVILMDIDMPALSGIEAVKRIRKVDSKTAVIMLTVFDDNQNVLDAICAGASGYLLKKHIPIRLFEAINEVMEGGAPMSPSVARMVINSMQQKHLPENPYKLTSREKEILGSLSKGNSYKMIASAFNVSIDTVRSHIKKIYEKMHVNSQTEAVSKAINEKLV